MLIDYYTWSSVIIRYDEPVPSDRSKRVFIRTEEIRDAYVVFEDSDHTLTIRSKDGYRHLGMSRAKAIKITPCDAEFEAYCWTTPIGAKKYEKLIRGVVTCQFENRNG